MRNQMTLVCTFLCMIAGISPAFAEPTTGPVPYDGAASVPTEGLLLVWTPVANAVSYRVYLGTQVGGLDLLGTVIEAEWRLTDELVRGKEYLWRVDSILVDETVVVGDPWAFTTLAPLAEDPNLLAWYPLDAGAGDIAWDYSGANRHAQLVDMIWDTQQRPPMGGAVVRSTGMGYLAPPLVDNLNDTLGLTVQAWFRLEATSELVLLSIGNGPAVSLSCYVEDNRLSLEITGITVQGRRSKIPPRVPTDVVFPREQWVHLATAIDVPSGTIAVYQNGVEALRLAGYTVSELLSGNTDIRLGCHVTQAAGYVGGLDQVKIYDRALSPDEAAYAMDHHPASPHDPNPRQWGFIYKESTVKLGWQASADAIAYQIYVGNQPDQLEPVLESSARSISVSTQDMPVHEPIYWQVETILAEGCLRSPVWQFSLSDLSMDDLIRQMDWTIKHTSYYGNPVKDVTLIDLDGNRHLFSQYLGRHVQFIQWAPWCGYCRMELEGLPELRETVSEDELMIIANTVRTEEASAQSYLAQHPEISCPVTLHDKSELPMPFSDTSGIPHNFFVSPDGTLKFSKAGVRRPDEIKLIMQAAWKQ